MEDSAIENIRISAVALNPNLDHSRGCRPYDVEGTTEETATSTTTMSFSIMWYFIHVEVRGHAGLLHLH